MIKMIQRIDTEEPPSFDVVEDGTANPTNRLRSVE
jgi:hypothetical protein